MFEPGAVIALLLPLSHCQTEHSTEQSAESAEAVCCIVSVIESIQFKNKLIFLWPLHRPPLCTHERCSFLPCMQLLEESAWLAWKSFYPLGYASLVKPQSRQMNQSWGFQRSLKESSIQNPLKFNGSGAFMLSGAFENPSLCLWVKSRRWGQELSPCCCVF